jgi:predicted permease
VLAKVAPVHHYLRWRYLNTGGNADYCRYIAEPGIAGLELVNTRGCEEPAVAEAVAPLLPGADAVVAVVAIFAVFLPIVPLVTRDEGRRGALMQSVVRSNYALVGIPLAASLFGESGELVATVLSAVMIPVFNILAVVALSVYKGQGEPIGKRILGVVLGVVKNPLILSIAAGFFALGIRAVFAEMNIGFRLSEIGFLMKILNYMSSVSTPLALLVLGSQFEFSLVSGVRREIAFGLAVRSVLVPLIGVASAYLLFGDRFGGGEYAALVAVFCTPVAVSSVPMAQEMGADVPLAGQLVLFSTLTSAVTVFVCSFILKQIGIF